MMSRKVKVAGIMVMMCVLFSGCASYNTMSLPSADTFAYSNRQTVENVSIAVEFFDASQTKKVFQTDLLSKGYQPVYIVIDNRSKATYIFNKSQISKNCYDASVIAEKCGFSTTGRATSYGVGAIFLWPLAIPAIVDGTGSARANTQMKNDYAMKEIKNGRVSPNGLLNGVVFVDKMANGEHFDIRLQNIETNEILLFNFIR